MTGEDGKELEPLFGPGLTGLRNLGNSCYIASILQALMSLPAFATRYYQSSSAASHAFLCKQQDPSTCLECQMIKVADGLLSGRYAVPREAEDEAKFSPSHESVPQDATPPSLAFQEGIKPSMFKSLIGKDHEEFKTMRQQDADEFLKHLLKTLERSQMADVQDDQAVDATAIFKFSLETRLQCSECKGVRYKSEEAEALSVPVPAVRKADASAMEVDTVNATSQGQEKKAEYEDVDLTHCLDLLTGQQDLEYKCPKCSKTVVAHQYVVDLFVRTRSDRS